jgi:hypothetical protein
MSTEELIQKITPLYNAYQKGHTAHQPIDLLYLMWDIGEEIEQYIRVHDKLPHTLFRDIYGKSESARNIKQKSYITREFLSRSYRVNKMFLSKSEILRAFPNLTAINHFRESMPFLDNPKYSLAESEKTRLLAAINGPLSNKEKAQYIRNLQKEKIGIRNPRTQQLECLDEDKLNFVKFYNAVYSALQLRDYALARARLELPSSKLIGILSLNCGAVSSDGLLMEKFEIPKRLAPDWRTFAEIIYKLISNDSPIDRRRFRRLISPERMLRLSEMLYALTSPEKYQNFKL